ncbi:MAG: hypothetical protein JWN34_4291 [Bryobacterales bacterium]|nr:hypothetical protein [Bryobacterales bacterium]
MLASLFVSPAAEFLRRGALGLRCEATDFRAKRGPAWTANFRHNLRAGDQVIKPSPGFGSVAFLGAVLASRDDENAVLRDAIAGQCEEALPYVLWKRRRLTDVEAQLDGGGNLVDVLAARPGGANERLGQFGIWNVYRHVLFPSCPLATPGQRLQSASALFHDGLQFLEDDAVTLAIREEFGVVPARSLVGVAQVPKRLLNGARQQCDLILIEYGKVEGWRFCHIEPASNRHAIVIVRIRVSWPNLRSPRWIAHFPR